MSTSGPEILFVAGPTGVGKSEIALQLARRLNAAILVMDSMQVYREANIGTSKPSQAEQREIAHGGIDLVDLGDSFDVGAYLKHAALFLDRCSRIGQSVVIVGGTGLYYRALTQGLCEAPAAANELRELLAQMTLEELQKRLAETDPEIVPHLDLKNPRRIARAIEVMETTGISLRKWQQDTRPPLIKSFRAFYIERDKSDLHARINQRVDQMLEAGWIDEVRTLVERHGLDALLNFPAIGYPELAAWLQSNGDLNLVREAIALATRQYAKRQLTWFRRESKLIAVPMAPNELSTAAADRLL
ncbi:MAG: tRNA (adenosine(37)-N6)-dimethylallyltransferase MiaA [Verrucomicrobia bacterium Tous-C9LFEB]|nr:MAG: tRNA (adenosine(37)-N6)-dimethylallyltransferase MiaA [Verrucomicrobia bacterium Tous-C9LFEB]